MSSIQELLDKFLYSVQEYNKDNAATLTNIIDQLEELAKHSHSLDYLSLNNTALLLQDNLLCIFEENQNLSDQQYSLLKKWPELLDNYFNGRDIESTTNNILSNLCDQSWPITLGENDEIILRELLLASSNSGSETSTTDEDDLLSNTFTDLVTTASKIVGNDSNYLFNFEDKITKIADSAQLSGFIGFHDLCLMALDNITILSSNIDCVSDTQLTLISSWLGLANKYINDPSNHKLAIALIDNLSDEHWPSPIPEEDKAILLDILGIKEVEVETHQEKIDPSFTRTLNKTKNLILRCNESEQRFSEISDSIQILIDIASSENLLGLQDICLLFQESLDEFIANKGKLTDNELRYLAECPVLLEKYYNDPKDSNNISALIRYLQNPILKSPLTIEDAELLKNMLGNVNEDTGVHTFHGNLLASAIEQNNITNSLEINDTHSDDFDGIVSEELIEMLLTEMQSIANESGSLLPNLNDTDESIYEKLSNFHLRLERFANACQAAELTGLYQACSIFLESLHTFISNKSYESDFLDVINLWIITVTEYLDNLGDKNISTRLSDILSSDAFKDPISQELSCMLVELLEKPVAITKSDLTEVETISEVSDDDLSITITDDINQDLLDGLLQELPGQTFELSKCIQSICSDNPEISELDKAQRIAHTIKGAANTVGIKGIAFLTHQLEDVLLILKQNNKLPSALLADTLISSTDCLEEMSDALMKGQESPLYAKDVIQNVLDWSNLLQNKGVEILDSDDFESEFDSIHALPTESVDNQKEDTSDKKVIETINIPVNTIDNLLRLMGETMIINLQLNEKVHFSNQKTSNLREHNSTIRELTNELERYIEMSGNALSKKKVVNQSETFDPLELEEYNELHTTSNRIVESATDAHEINSDIETELKSLTELLFSQSNIQQEIYDLVMRSRMVPISSILPRLERCVRQTCRTTNKKVDLECIGKDTLIDRNILNKMIDPLMHMIRNSIDHGIEAPDVRKGKGKNITGKIFLKVNRAGSLIHIDFTDDGQGLDVNKINNIAKHRGIIENDDEMSNDELYRLILQPGFTTKESTTQTSGRGIGMDVVYSQILSLNGRLQIFSKPDQGIHFELSLPVSLMTSHAVFIEHQQQTLAISNYNIVRILHPSDSNIILDKGQQKVVVENEILEMDTIEFLLHSSDENRIDPESQRPGLLINYENKKRVVFIDDILDSRNIVIKDMGSYLKKVQGVIGATIVGDGSVVPVLDLSELIRISLFTKTSSKISLAHTSVIKLLPTIMIVDDSISTRRALSQIMKDAGYDVVTAKDGIEAIGIMEKKPPSIILVDFEMPRMNGIELASHVRGMDNLKDIPIIMITSRTTDKHKELAFDAGVNKYTIKPFSEDALLDDVAILLDDDL